MLLPGKKGVVGVSMSYVMGFLSGICAAIVVWAGFSYFRAWQATQKIRKALNLKGGK
jgi:hypothetical protein